MPIATVTKTIILADGTIQKTVERQHKDREGKILKILSRTTEIVPSPDGGAVVKSSVVPPSTPALQDPAEDFLVSHLRRRTQSKNRSSSDPVNSSKDVSIHSDTKTEDPYNKASPEASFLGPDIEIDRNMASSTGAGSTSGSIRLHDSPASSLYSLGEATSESSHGDSLIEHLRRRNVQNKTTKPQNQDETLQQSQKSSCPQVFKPPSPANAHAVAEPQPAVQQPNKTTEVFVPPTMPIRVQTPAVPQQTMPSAPYQRAPPVRIQTTAVPQQTAIPTAPHPSAQAPPMRIQATAVPQQKAILTAPHPLAQAPPIRIQTTAVPQQTAIPTAPHPSAQAPPVRIQTTAVPQSPQGLPTHLPAVITRLQPQPSRPQIVQQNDNGQQLETAEDALDLAEMAHELFGGGDENEGITVDVNFGGQQQENGLNPNAIRHGLRWGRVGLRAARLGADLLGLGDSGELLETAFSAGDLAEACVTEE